MQISELLRHAFLFLVLVTPFFGSIPANAATSAQENPQTSAPSTSAGLAIETLAERRVITSSSEGAQVEFVAADQLHIGDEIFYTLRVRNATNAVIDKVVVIKAVPRNTQYVADSAVGPAATIGFSVDGGATFAASDELEVITLPGVARRAIMSDYTHLRWQLRHPLAPGATALLRFRGIFR